MSAWDPCRTGDAVEQLLVRQDGPATIVAPFAKASVVEHLCSLVRDRVDLYTRWLPQEVAAGVSDLGVLEVIQQTGGEVRLHPRVHAKLYLRGDEALVGSANASRTGLGYRQPAAVELLVPVRSSCEPISCLLAALGAQSARADESIRDAVEQAAQQIGAASTSLPPEAAEDSLLPAPRDTHIMVFRDPKAVWVYYSDPSSHSEDLGRNALTTLASMGIPPGIAGEETFKVLVGVAMRQGTHGRILAECRGLPPHAAVELFRQIMSEVGTDIPAEEADREWRSFCYWAAHFVPEVELRTAKVGF